MDLELGGVRCGLVADTDDTYVMRQDMRDGVLGNVKLCHIYLNKHAFVGIPLA